MNPIFFISHQKPQSIQSKKPILPFQQKLRDDFEANFEYDDLPLSIPLYTKILYIYKEKKGDKLDVDNMSKPIVDAFKNIIYSDDNIINHRICSKIERSALDIVEIEETQLPRDITEKLIEFFRRDLDHILLFEVGVFTQDMIKFAGV
jgi:hypothetical protein